MSGSLFARLTRSTCICALANIEEIARAAGEVLRRGYGDPGRVMDKASDYFRRDVVTDTDFAAEEVIVTAIEKIAPDAVIFAEERGLQGMDGAAPDIREIDDLWVIDPLDGTINFANGLPGFCVSIARYRNGEPAEGVIYDPLLDELFRFSAGASPTRNGEPISIGIKDDFTQAVVSIGALTPDLALGLRRCRVWRRLGSAALAMAYVACGRLDSYVQLGGLSAWDVAVGAPLVQAAGGTVSWPAGEGWQFAIDRTTGIVCGNDAMHDATVAAIDG